MNDPNGLVFHDGEYHLFHQANPFGNAWGHMSWGHAVSRDLVRWAHLPVAIPEEGGVMIFSGSAVADPRNTTRFGQAGSIPLVAVYTGHHAESGIQDQNLAYSLDRGRTWRKYAGNPVLDDGSRDFRDPKVFWHEPDACWIMAVALAAERKIRFYRSPDLIRWERTGEFGPAGPAAGAWECPDLFELPVEGGSGAARWVLHVNVNAGAPAGGSGGLYFTGDFDGAAFTAGDSGRAEWTDYGPDFYAAVSWEGVPGADGRRIWIGWMSNWAYAGDVPTSPWRGGMTLPRSLALRRAGNGFLLVQRPVRELEGLRRGGRRREGVLIRAGDGLLDLGADPSGGLEVEAAFRVRSPGSFGFRWKAGAMDCRLGYDPARRRLFVDRRLSGPDSVAPGFPALHEAPLDPENGLVRIHAYFDRTSIEVFGNGGARCLTALVFPPPGRGRLGLFSEAGEVEVERLDVWGMKSIW
jgi:fructan beta-fructosidase